MTCNVSGVNAHRGGKGQEPIAATVGPVHALRRGVDYALPMIRNSGACNEMGMPIADILRGYLGTGDGPSRGRDGHYGDLARHILPPISHVGDMVAVHWTAEAEFIT